MSHYPQVFALVATSAGEVIIAADDISHCVEFDTATEVHPAFADSKQTTGMRVHFKAKGSTHLDLPGITARGLAEALNGAAF